MEEVASGGVSSTRDGDLDRDLAGELCLLSRLLERELFSGFGELLEHFGESAGLALMLVAVLRLFTTVVGLTVSRCLLFPKKRLSLGVL